MSVSVRSAEQEDLPQVLSLLDELRKGATPLVPWTRPDTAKAEATWERMLTDPGRIILVAELDGLLVGTADLIVVPNLTHDAASIAYVENVAVATSQRRTGVGRALMAESEARARAAGCYKIQLLSFKGRDDAHAFYQSLGYEDSAVGFRRYLI